MAISIACGSSGTVVNTPTGKTNEGLPTIAVQATKIDVPLPTKTPIPEPTKQLGLAKSNPAPVGSEVITDDMAIVVDKLVRPATAIVMEGNMFNTEPEPTQEYIFVNVKLTCKKGGDDTCNHSTLMNVKLVGSKGIERNPEYFISGVDGVIPDADFYGGSSITGYIPFIIDKDENNLILIYETLFGDPVYLSISEPSTL